MSHLASKFSDRHANEIKREAAVIFKAEQVAERNRRRLRDGLHVPRAETQALVESLERVCSIARDYHLSAAELVD